MNKKSTKIQNIVFALIFIGAIISSARNGNTHWLSITLSCLSYGYIGILVYRHQTKDGIEKAKSRKLNKFDTFTLAVGGILIIALILFFIIT